MGRNMRFRLTVTDAIERDGAVLVLAGDTVHLLGPLASAIVAAHGVVPSEGGWSEVDQLPSRVEEMLGEAPGSNARDLILAVIEELEAAGVVEVAT